MAKFLVVHPVGKDMTVESGAPIAKAVKAHVTTDAFWVGSKYAREEGKLYCEWDAKDAAAIQAVLEKVAKAMAPAVMPTEGIYKLDMIVDAEEYR